MKLVIGLAGPPLAGKETVAETLEHLLTADGFSVRRHRFSDILRETLDLWGMPHGRSNEQILAQIMQRPGGFPEGVLARAIHFRLSKDHSDVGILDGMRWDVDEKMVRSFPEENIQSMVIGIEANEDYRYARMKTRARSGEEHITREAFTLLQQQPNEIFISTIVHRADLVLTNNYEEKAPFESVIKEAYQQKILPLVRA